MHNPTQASFNYAINENDHLSMKNRLKNLYKYPLIIILILSSQCVMADELQLGLAVLNSQSAIQGKAVETELLPAIIYQGENFSFIFDTLSYGLFASDSLSISMTGQLRLETYKPKDSEALNGMDKRDSSLDLGINIQSNHSWGTLELAASGDVSSTYDGYEVKASYAYPWMRGRWLLKPEVGVSYLSQQLVDYYYGVNISEQKASRPAYNGEATVNSFFNFSVFYRLNEKWNVIGGIVYVHLDDAISKSPIVDESHEASAFMAVTYTY